MFNDIRLSTEMNTNYKEYLERSISDVSEINLDTHSYINNILRTIFSY